MDKQSDNEAKQRNTDRFGRKSSAYRRDDNPAGASKQAQPGRDDIKPATESRTAK